MSNITLNELLEAGSHFGHQVRRWNPAMKQYIYGERDGVHIFDLAKTKNGLDAALEFVKQLGAEGKTILFVGTKRQASDFLKAEALRAGVPYVSVRWMGGMLTNFKELNKRVKEMNKLKGQKAAGELKRYTKKEQLLIDREIEKLEKFFGGSAALEQMPGAMFVVDTHHEDVAVREANRMNVPVIGMVDTNADPRKVDYVIPVNDDAAKSIELVVKAVTDAYISGKNGNAAVADDKPKKAKKEKKEEAGEETHEA